MIFWLLLRVVGVVQDDAELVADEFGTGPTGSGHGFIIPNICKSFFLLGFLVADTTIIVEGRHSFCERDAFEEIQVQGCPKGTVSTVKPGKHHGDNAAKRSLPFARLTQKPQGMVT